MSLNSALSGLSSSCQQALPGLLTSGFASCANVLGLVQVATGSGSIIEPLTSYIEDLCTSAPCTQSDLSNASSIITNGCQTDIQSGSIIPTALNLVIDNFGGVRSLLCTQQQSNGTYCVPEVLSAAQNSTGTSFSLSTLTSLATGNNTDALLNSIPTSVYCTDCGHAITTEALAIVKNVSADAAPAVSSAAAQKCGASFADGQLPSGIVTAGATGQASTANSSTGAAPRGLSLSSKTVAILGTVSAVILGASMTLA